MESKVIEKLLLKSEHLADLPELAAKIVSFAGNHKIWLFEGEMGAGKTTLIKVICEYFGVIDRTSSPTFAIVNEYHNEEAQVFYHFDFYRINKQQEALDIGCMEYFDSGDYCFIEWPSKITDLLPDQFMEIKLDITAETARTITLTRHD